MKLYFAAAYTSSWGPCSRTQKYLTESEYKALQKGLANTLESYYYLKPNDVGDIREFGNTVFVDSGAYSAWTKKTVIPVQEYGDWVLQHLDLIRKDGKDLMVANLDVIGDADGTHENQLALEAMGLQVIPVFHLGEDESYLRDYVTQYDYVSLGGMVGTPSGQLRAALDHLWSKYLVNPDGTAKRKVHGFGMTSKPLMERYPWHSVDSTGYIRYGSMGNIYDPVYGLVRLAEGAAGSPGITPFNNLALTAQREILERIATMGFDFGRLVDKGRLRVIYTACVMASEHVTGHPFTETPLSLF